MKIADAKNRVPMAASESTRLRRTYPRQFKSEVVAQCLAAGASVSAIALSHGINANVIRKWLPRHRPGSSGSLTTMLPVTLDTASAAPASRPGTHGPRAATRPPIELTLAGATVRLPAGFDPQELRSVVQILATLR